MTTIKITRVEKPAGQVTMWCGRASSPRRIYEWFFMPETGAFWAMSQRPSEPGCFMSIDHLPAGLRPAAMEAIKQEQQQ